MEQKRKIWIDSVKGIGVVLIVLGHLLYYSKTINPIVNKIIYSFHVPVFFMISGYLCKNVTKGYLLKKVKRLIVPFIIYSIMGIPIFGLKLFLEGNNVFTIIKNLFYIDGIVENNPLWFLIALFEIHIINYFLNLPSKDNKIIITYTFLFIMIGALIYHISFFSFLNIFGLNRAIVCFSFFSFGILIKKYNIKKYYIIIFFIALIINLIFGAWINDKVSIYGFNFGKYIAFIIAAFSGSIAIIIFCKTKFDKSNVISKLSNYSVLFIGTQYFYILAIYKLLNILKISNIYIYDLILFISADIYIIFLPIVYKLLRKKFEFLKYLNGE